MRSLTSVRKISRRCDQSLIVTVPSKNEWLMAERSRLAHVLVLAGCAFLLVVVLTHVAEHYNIFAAMGWGQPNSPGHYLDLVSAIAGIGFLIIGLVLGQN